MISAKGNNPQNANNLFPPSQRHEIENQINQNQPIHSQDQNNLPFVQLSSNLPNTENLTNSLSNKIDEISVREWVNSLKYCTQEKIDEVKRKKHIRDPTYKFSQIGFKR